MKKNSVAFNNKKDKLKDIALHSYNNGGIIYQLINEGDLDSIILKKIKLENNPFVFKNLIVTDEEFIYNLNDLIHFFDNSFAPLHYKHHRLSNIFEDKCPQFLLSKEKVNSATDYFLAKKFLVKNMYDNIKFIYDEHKDFFKKANIKKNMSLNNKNNIEILFNFMKQLNWCNYDNRAMYYVFTNYNNVIKEKMSNNNQQEVISNVLYTFIENWTELIANYNKNINKIKNLIR